jgi:hypothetical protein
MTHQYFLLLCNLRNVTLYNKSVVFCINFQVLLATGNVININNCFVL